MDFIKKNRSKMAVPLGTSLLICLTVVTCALPQGADIKWTHPPFLNFGYGIKIHDVVDPNMNDKNERIVFYFGEGQDTSSFYPGDDLAIEKCLAHEINGVWQCDGQSESLDLNEYLPTDFCQFGPGQPGAELCFICNDYSTPCSSSDNNCCQFIGFQYDTEEYILSESSRVTGSFTYAYAWDWTEKDGLDDKIYDRLTIWVDNLEGDASSNYLYFVTINGQYTLEFVSHAHDDSWDEIPYLKSRRPAFNSGLGIGEPFPPHGELKMEFSEPMRIVAPHAWYDPAPPPSEDSFIGLDEYGQEISDFTNSTVFRGWMDAGLPPNTDVNIILFGEGNEWWSMLNYHPDDLIGQSVRPSEIGHDQYLVWPPLQDADGTRMAMGDYIEAVENPAGSGVLEESYTMDEFSSHDPYDVVELLFKTSPVRADVRYDKDNIDNELLAPYMPLSGCVEMSAQVDEAEVDGLDLEVLDPSADYADSGLGLGSCGPISSGQAACAFDFSGVPVSGKTYSIRFNSYYGAALKGLDQINAQFDLTGDHDADGLSDAQEIQNHSTDPCIADTDGDGLFDGDEVYTYMTDPTDPDTDGDGMPDGWEHVNGLDPLDDGDWDDDQDSDGLTNLNEFNNGTDPSNQDTDGDGLFDDMEIFYGYPYDPLEPQENSNIIVDARSSVFGSFDDPYNHRTIPNMDTGLYELFLLNQAKDTFDYVGNGMLLFEIDANGSLTLVRHLNSDVSSGDWDGVDTEDQWFEDTITSFALNGDELVIGSFRGGLYYYDLVNEKINKHFTMANTNVAATITQIAGNDIYLVPDDCDIVNPLCPSPSTTPCLSSDLTSGWDWQNAINRQIMINGYSFIVTSISVAGSEIVVQLLQPMEYFARPDPIQGVGPSYNKAVFQTGLIENNVFQIQADSDDIWINSGRSQMKSPFLGADETGGMSKIKKSGIQDGNSSIRPQASEAGYNMYPAASFHIDSNETKWIVWDNSDSATETAIGKLTLIGDYNEKTYTYADPSTIYGAEPISVIEDAQLGEKKYLLFGTKYNAGSIEKGVFVYDIDSDIFIAKLRHNLDDYYHVIDGDQSGDPNSILGNNVFAIKAQVVKVGPSNNEKDHVFAWIATDHGVSLVDLPQTSTDELENCGTNCAFEHFDASSKVTNGWDYSGYPMMHDDVLQYSCLPDNIVYDVHVESAIPANDIKDVTWTVWFATASGLARFKGTSEEFQYVDSQCEQLHWDYYNNSTDSLLFPDQKNDKVSSMLFFNHGDKDYLAVGSGDPFYHNTGNTSKEIELLNEANKTSPNKPFRKVRANIFINEDWTQNVWERGYNSIYNFYTKDFHDATSVTGDECGIEEPQCIEDEIHRLKFGNLDLIMDKLVQERDVIPIIGFHSFPMIIWNEMGKDCGHFFASDPEHSMGCWGSVDWRVYQNLVYALLYHYRERYGSDKVNSWYLEIYNENGPFDLNDDYYQATLEAIEAFEAKYGKTINFGVNKSGFVDDFSFSEGDDGWMSRLDIITCHPYDHASLYKASPIHLQTHLDGVRASRLWIHKLFPHATWAYTEDGPWFSTDSRANYDIFLRTYNNHRFGIYNWDGVRDIHDSSMLDILRPPDFSNHENFNFSKAGSFVNLWNYTNYIEDKAVVRNVNFTAQEALSHLGDLRIFASKYGNGSEMAPFATLDSHNMGSIAVAAQDYSFWGLYPDDLLDQALVNRSVRTHNITINGLDPNAEYNVLEYKLDEEHGSESDDDYYLGAYYQYMEQGCAIKPQNCTGPVLEKIIEDSKLKRLKGASERAFSEMVSGSSHIDGSIDLVEGGAYVVELQAAPVLHHDPAQIPAEHSMISDPAGNIFVTYKAGDSLFLKSWDVNTNKWSVEGVLDFDDSRSVSDVQYVVDAQSYLASFQDGAPGGPYEGKKIIHLADHYIHPESIVLTQTGIDYTPRNACYQGMYNLKYNYHDKTLELCPGSEMSDGQVTVNYDRSVVLLGAESSANQPGLYAHDGVSLFGHVVEQNGLVGGQISLSTAPDSANNPGAVHYAYINDDTADTVRYSQCVFSSSSPYISCLDAIEIAEIDIGNGAIDMTSKEIYNAFYGQTRNTAFISKLDVSGTGQISAYAAHLNQAQTGLASALLRVEYIPVSGRLNFDTSCSLFNNNFIAHLAYGANEYGTGKIYYSFISGGQYLTILVSDGSADATDPSITIDPAGDVNVVYMQVVDGSIQIHHRKVMIKYDSDASGYDLHLGDVRNVTDYDLSEDASAPVVDVDRNLHMSFLWLDKYSFKEDSENDKLMYRYVRQ